ncbi:hypothetical protein LNP18_06610 [Leuconostoc citreum]|uniref:hypothetical protein n=1 Tax=Leuconostoc citreum TaxID=33964 RepID=UPI002009F2E9|nr:hypothetical protein [Leuconostoc citreum]MCK8605776.1 hypothetical protein [Leuconostoc citreum]
MDSSKGRFKINVDGQYLADGLKNISKIKDENLRITLKWVTNLKWLIFGLVILNSLIICIMFWFQLIRLLFCVYLILFTFIVILNFVFMKYSIWGKVSIIKKKPMPYIDLIIRKQHYVYQNDEFNRYKITSDELLTVLYLYVKWYLLLFEILFVFHLATVLLAFYINSWFSGVLIIVSVILAYLVYCFLGEILGVISDLFFIKKTFKI